MKTGSSWTLDCFRAAVKKLPKKTKSSPLTRECLPILWRMLTNIVLSHAHIDHSGRIPLLAKHEFSGRIICTRATAAASEYLLRDSAHIQESDANYLNYKTARNALTRKGSSKSGKKSGVRLKAAKKAGTVKTKKQGKF
jgi:metallo-beta-lactamase family protein